MGLSDNTRGALLMAGSMAGFTVNDAFMKGLSGDLPLAQAIFLRGVGVTLILLVLAHVTGQLRLRLPRQDGHLLLLRSGCEVGAVFFFLTAVFNMPLANAASIIQVLPLVVTLAGAVAFGEPLGWRRLTAILIGFGGVMLIVRPGVEGFTIYSLYALAAVGFVTVRDLSVRRMSGALPSLTVALVGAVIVTLVAGVASAMQPWTPVDASAAGLLAGATLCILIAYVLSVSAMRVGDLAVVAPFRYSALLVALLVGWLAFGEWPDALTLVGAAIVTATGLFTLWREGRLARAAAAPRPDVTAAPLRRVDTPSDSL